MGNTTSKHPVTLYAEAVLSGQILQGPHVRLACQRHLDMMAEKNAPYYFDEEAAWYWIEFFPDCLVVEVAGETEPFDLLDYQIFIAGSLGGWKDKRTGFRWFRKAYVEGAKGCGKSPFAAGIGLLMMLADNEFRAEVYSAGAKREQGQVLFRDAVAMVDMAPALQGKVVQNGKDENVWQLVHRPSRSLFKVLARDKKKSGQRPHCALVDELHEHGDRYTIDMLGQGFKGRRQPLLFVITNSGFDRTSVCYEWHVNGIKVLNGEREDPRGFFFIMALDPGDDPFKDPDCWPKTNPGLGVTITWEYLEDQVREGRQIPGRENIVRRLNFCQWTDADVGWMTREAWEKCEEELVEFIKPAGDLSGGGAAKCIEGEGFHGALCFLSLDLAHVTDLAALTFTFPEDDLLLQWTEFFMPIGEHLSELEAKERKDDAPYIEWIRAGHIHGIRGPVIRKEHIAARLAEVQTQYDVRYAAYDRYAHKALEMEMAEQGVFLPWIEHPQGFRRGGLLKDRAGNYVLDDKGLKTENPLYMPDSVSKYESRILERTIRIQPSPVIRWQVANVAIRQDPAGTGNRIFDKNKSISRIDGVVSSGMGVGLADARFPEQDLSEFLKKPVIVR